MYPNRLDTYVSSAYFLTVHPLTHCRTHSTTQQSRPLTHSLTHSLTQMLTHSSNSRKIWYLITPTHSSPGLLTWSVVQIMSQHRRHIFRWDLYCFLWLRVLYGSCSKIGWLCISYMIICHQDIVDPRIFILVMCIVLLYMYFSVRRVTYSTRNIITRKKYVEVTSLV